MPETGCFLASHPAYYRRQALYLTQSVVFLTSYNRAAGAAGLVLNRPLAGTAEELEEAGVFGRSLDISSTPFSKQPVYIGGPHSLDKGVLSVVHADANVGGSQPLPGVFVCDLAHFLDNAGDADVSKARLFFGCLRWRSGELDGEVDEGSWFCAAASELFATKHCIQLPKPLWVEIMQCQGEPFAMIANNVYERRNKSDSGQSEDK